MSRSEFGEAKFNVAAAAILGELSSLGLRDGKEKEKKIAVKVGICRVPSTPPPTHTHPFYSNFNVTATSISGLLSIH